MKLVAAALIATLSTSCSVAFQDGVRSSGYNCSTSYGWAASDAVLAAGWAFVASTGGNTSNQPEYVVPAEVLAGTFIAAAAIGAYKAHHCANYLEQPEVIAQIKADREGMAEAEARGRAAVEAAAAACAAQGGCNTGDAADGTGDATADQGPTCPDGQQLGGTFWDSCFTCPEGASIGGFANRECICPAGTSSNGSACVAPSGEAAPPAPKQPHHKVAQPAPQPQPHVTITHAQPATKVFGAAAVSAVLGGDIKNCRTLDSMTACTQYCSGQKLQCQCVTGGC